MNLDVNQDNLYLLLPSKVSLIANMITDDKGIGVVDAIRLIYQSRTYQELETEETKFWHLGPVALYQDFSNNFSL